MSLERALELAERGRGTRTEPPVGAVVVAGGEVVGEGWPSRTAAGTREVVALDAAGERRRGATLYVTLEPCAHHGRTPPCTDAIARRRDRAGRRRLARPEPGGGGRARAAARGRASRSSSSTASRRAPERGLADVGRARRPFVTYKAAVTLDGRVTVPGRALGHRRGVAGGSSTSCAPPPTRSRSGWAPCAPTRLGSTRATSTRRASRGGSRSAAARCRTARSSSCAPARSRRSSPRSPPRASSRCCSRAGRRSRRRSSRRVWSTSCCSSSRRRSRATGRAFLGDLPAPVDAARSLDAEPVGDDVLVEALPRASPRRDRSRR